MVAGRTLLLFYSYRVTPQSSPSTISYAYIDPSLTTTQPLLSLSSSLDILHNPNLQADRGWGWSRKESHHNKIPVPADCLVVDAGRFNDRGEGS